MQIVILDGHTLNPGDLSWAPLEELGNLTIFPRTNPEEIAERIADAEIVLVNKVKLNAGHFENAKNLKFIAETATGTDNLDLEAARNAGITVSNVPSYSASFTAQTAIALLLELTHHVGKNSDAVRNGDWENSPDFCFWRAPLIDLDGKTLVVLGLGTIGGKVAQIATALGMKVIAAQLPGRERDSQSHHLPLEEALPLADVISIHCPLKPATRELVDANFLAKCKPGALLINTARGAILNEKDVANALESGQLGGFAADVLSVEPPTSDNPLLRAKNAIITPHLGWASPEARAKCLKVTIENVRAFLAGAPQNVVNG